MVNPRQTSDLGFLPLVGLGIRAKRTLVVCASQCVGPRLTVSGRCASHGCDLGFLSMASACPGSPGSSWGAICWPLVQRSCRGLGLALWLTRQSCAILIIAGSDRHSACARSEGNERRLSLERECALPR